MAKKEFELPARATVPEIALEKKPAKKTSVYLVALFTGEEGGKDAAPELPATSLLDEQELKSVYESLTAVGATGTSGEVTRVPAPSTSDAAAVVAIGLGDPEELDDEELRRAAGVAARALGDDDVVATTLGDLGVAPVVEGLILGGYSYRGLRSAKDDEGTKGNKSKKDKNDKPVKITLISSDKEAKKEFVAAQITAESVAFARDLVNTPSSHLYPEVYAELLQTAGAEAGLEVEVLDEKALAKAGYGGILAVGAGSERGPRLVRLTWTPNKQRASVALVGKGITFDTGGISLKPASKMENMISDMGGSAAMAGAIIAAARMNLQVKITATLPLAENMPSGAATRPGDVITHYGGVTSEIINTDAEGRLVLADALARASEDEPDFLLETATLTGAQMVALGARTAGVMGTDEFRDRVAETGRAVGENAWAMPLLEEQEEELKSPIADIRNSHNSRNAGMLFAAQYLSRFVGEDIQWAHIDVAGPSFNDGGVYGYTPKRATGTPLRTVVQVLRELAEKK